jgi:hypothetical protein
MIVPIMMPQIDSKSLGDLCYQANHISPYDGSRKFPKDDIRAMVSAVGMDGLYNITSEDRLKMLHFGYLVYDEGTNVYILCSEGVRLTSYGNTHIAVGSLLDWKQVIKKHKNNELVKEIYKHLSSLGISRIWN